MIVSAFFPSCTDGPLTPRLPALFGSDNATLENPSPKLTRTEPRTEPTPAMHVRTNPGHKDESSLAPSAVTPTGVNRPQQPLEPTPASSTFPQPSQKSRAALSQQTSISSIESSSPISSSFPQPSPILLPLSQTSSAPLSQQSSLSSISSFSSVIELDGALTAPARGFMDEQQVEKILGLAADVQYGCRICFHRRELSQSRHWTYHCPAAICSTPEWKLFKTGVPFPRRAVCFYCFGPFGDPFHEEPPTIPASPQDCIFKDAFKELSYIIWQDVDTRRAIFNRLGSQMPETVGTYKRYLSKRISGGAFGIYEVLDAYIDVRA